MEHHYLQGSRDTERNLKEEALLSSPELTIFNSDASVLSHFLTTFHFIKPDIKILKLNPFFRSLSPSERSVSHKINEIYLCAFLLVICLCQFNFLAQPETYRGARKSFPLLQLSLEPVHHFSCSQCLLPLPSIIPFWGISFHLLCLVLMSEEIKVLPKDHRGQRRSVMGCMYQNSHVETLPTLQCHGVSRWGLWKVMRT